MVKLKIEWHKECPNCGTELIVDFFDSGSDQCHCPWCGTSVGISSANVDSNLKNYLFNTFRTIEDEANNSILKT